MAQRAPWEDLTTPMYEACEVKKQKTWVIYGSWLLSALLVVGGFTTKYKIAFFFAFILVMSLISKKRVMVTERGLESFMDMRFTSNYQLWPWEEIEALTQETNKNFPGVELLYFTRDLRTRRVFFREEDAKAIRKLAGQKNKKLKLFDGNAYREMVAKERAAEKQARGKTRK